MGHRRLFCTSQTSEMDRENIWNHSYLDPRLQLENGSFLPPIENVANGVNSMAYLDMTVRSNDLSQPIFNSEVPNYRAARLGTSQDPYLHPPSASSYNRIPPNYVQSGASSFNRLTIGHAGSSFNPQMEYGRVPFKRKTPGISMADDRGNTNGYYSAGSSSSLSVPSANLQPNPMLGPQYSPWSPVSLAPSYRTNNVLAVGEGSQRNVRSRHSDALRLENNPPGAHSSSSPAHHLHSMANISGLTVAGQWSHTPVNLDSHRRILSSDIGCFNHEMNQSLAGSSSTNVTMEIDRGYHHNPRGIPSQTVGVGHSSSGQRTIPYRASSSYPPMGFAATLGDGRRPGMEAVPPYRHSRQLSMTGRSSERNGRARNFYDQFQPLPDGDNIRSRWVSEGVVMMDRASFYDSRNLFDQHRDMRLDIDNMSYEELLALEERIGNVSTGLTEDTISRCLVEMMYFSPNQIEDDQEEENCVICLEEYVDGESLGRLTCRHEFHASCIKKWLLVKNVCPICKASALADTSKEKQTVSL